MKDGTAGSEGCLGRRIKWCPEDVFEFSHGSTLRWWGTGDVLDLPSCHPPRSRKAMNCMVRSPKQPPRSFRDLLHHGVQHLSQQLPRAAATHCSGAKLTPSSTTKSTEHSGSTHPESPVHEHELGARHSGNRMSEQGNGQRSKVAVTILVDWADFGAQAARHLRTRNLRQVVHLRQTHSAMGKPWRGRGFKNPDFCGESFSQTQKRFVATNHHFGPARRHPKTPRDACDACHPATRATHAGVPR